MLRSVLSYLFAAVLLISSASAFPQVLSEFSQMEPGSRLFGTLQVVIGVSAVAAAIGLVSRARWASWFVASWGIAAVALLAVQPLFEPMDSGAQRSIWLGAAAVGAAAAGVSWYARRLHRGDVAARATAERAPDLLTDVRQPPEPIIVRAPGAHVSRGDERHDD